MKIYVTIAGERENTDLFFGLVENKTSYTPDWGFEENELAFIEDDADSLIEELEELADNAGLLIWHEVLD